jgi:hypothetical protein
MGVLLDKYLYCPDTTRVPAYIVSGCQHIKSHNSVLKGFSRMRGTQYDPNAALHSRMCRVSLDV